MSGVLLTRIYRHYDHDHTRYLEHRRQTLTEILALYVFEYSHVPCVKQELHLIINDDPWAPHQTRSVTILKNHNTTMPCGREEFPGSYSVVLDVKYNGSRGVKQAEIWVSDPRDYPSEYILAIQVAKENKKNGVAPVKRRKTGGKRPALKPPNLKRKRGRPPKVSREDTPVRICVMTQNLGPA